jgi:hypothetical protein
MEAESYCGIFVEFKRFVPSDKPARYIPSRSVNSAFNGFGIEKPALKEDLTEPNGAHFDKGYLPLHRASLSNQFSNRY